MDAWLAELDESKLDALADLLAPRIASRLQAAAPEPDGWLDAKGAAATWG
jgi:hypothetical protein